MYIFFQRKNNARSTGISCLSKTYLSRSSLTIWIRPRREEIHDEIIFAKENDVRASFDDNG